ncbi:MAG: glycosyltransferase [Deltaproteobacteria bacterium]
MPSVALTILNYNGRKHLEFLLPTALAEAARFGSNCQVVVLDNLSPDCDLEWVRQVYPSVQAIEAPENDFLFSYNWFAEQSTADILVYLNNDLKLCPGFVEPLVRHFSDPNVFAVSATSRDWDDKKFTFGPIQLRHHHGHYYWNPDYSKQKLSHTLFTSGGFMAVDRMKFLEIGGFSRLYYPAYCEDLDLCFRAWRQGWRCIFEPQSIVLHLEHGSWGLAGNTRSAAMQLRSKLLFEWSTLPPAGNIFERAGYNMLSFIRLACHWKLWQTRVYYSTLRDMKNAKAHVHLKTSRHELDSIIIRIDIPLAEAGIS